MFWSSAFSMKRFALLLACTEAASASRSEFKGRRASVRLLRRQPLRADGFVEVADRSSASAGHLLLHNADFEVDLHIRHTINGALKDRACMFSFVPLPGGGTEFAGAYRAGTCDSAGDQVVAFHAEGLDGARDPKDVHWLSSESMDSGEDPRCFVWSGKPCCLTWAQFNGPFKLLVLDKNHTRSVLLDPDVTGSVGGKNWVAVPGHDGKLYFVVSLQPLKVLRYTGDEDGMGTLTWHHRDEGESLFEWRGGTPALYFESSKGNGYVGLGHHTLSTSDHKVFAYIFGPDLHHVEFLNTTSFLLPSSGPVGVWDPLSIWQDRNSDAGLPQFEAVVSYWNDVGHSEQKTHLASFTVKSLA